MTRAALTIVALDDEERQHGAAVEGTPEAGNRAGGQDREGRLLFVRSMSLRFWWADEIGVVDSGGRPTVVRRDELVDRDVVMESLRSRDVEQESDGVLELDNSN